MGDVPDLPAPSGVDADAWAAAVAAARAFCGWHIAPSVTQTVTLDGGWSSVLILPSLHVTAVASVVNDGTPITAPDWSPAGMVRRGDCGVWSGKYQGVTVTFTHGYDRLPMDLQAVLTTMASRGVTAPQGSQLVAGPFQVNGVSVAAQDGAVGLTSGHLATLQRYALPPRP